jgi:hypothetical protein
MDGAFSTGTCPKVRAAADLITVGRMHLASVGLMLASR